MTDFDALCVAWQADQTAARQTWEAHRTPASAPDHEETDDMGAFKVEFPGKLEVRAAVAKYLANLAIRSGVRPGTEPGIPPLRFLADLAAAAEREGPAEISTAGLSHEDQLNVRRILVIADERSAWDVNADGLALPSFVKDLLRAWEAYQVHAAPAGDRLQPVRRTAAPGHGSAHRGTRLGVSVFTVDLGHDGLPDIGLSMALAAIGARRLREHGADDAAGRFIGRLAAAVRRGPDGEVSSQADASSLDHAAMLMVAELLEEAIVPTRADSIPAARALANVTGQWATYCKTNPGGTRGNPG